MPIDFCLIFVPFGHYDESEFLRYAITSICPVGAHVRQDHIKALQWYRKAAKLGVISLLGVGMFTHGIGLGELNFIMPFDFLRIVYASVLGFLLFSELPHLFALGGSPGNDGLAFGARI